MIISFALENFKWPQICILTQHSHFALFLLNLLIPNGNETDILNIMIPTIHTFGIDDVKILENY